VSETSSRPALPRHTYRGVLFRSLLWLLACTGVLACRTTASSPDRYVLLEAAEFT
jgi:hypothetical protein